MLTTRIVNFIGGHEKYVSTYYLDPVHTATIGYGFTNGSRVFRDWWMQKHGRPLRKGDTITQAEAHQVLLAILAEEAVPPVDAKLRAVAGNRILEAAYSFVFNCGAGAIEWKWAAALVRGDLVGAAALWRVTGTTAKGKRLPGLVRRRGEEADIAEFDKWPAWVGEAATPPESHVDRADIQQAQLWLTSLGYDCGAADGVPGPRTIAATTRFQTDHGALKVDGVIGAATLAALQRAVDLKSKAGKVVAGGGATTVAGGVEKGTGGADIVAPDAHAGWVGDVLLWGGLAVTAALLLWLAWRYRDEIATVLRKL